MKVLYAFLAICVAGLIFCIYMAVKQDEEFERRCDSMGGTYRVESEYAGQVQSGKVSTPIYTYEYFCDVNGKSYKF